MSKIIDVENCLRKAAIKHNGKYDYSKVHYKKWNEPVTIICPQHGEFKQTLHNHMNGQGCPVCGKKSAAEKMSLTAEEFIAKAKQVHGDRYDYSKSKYINMHSKVCIICPEHGEFWQTPGNHLSGSGCPKCFGKTRKTTDEFVAEARKKHGKKYGYSLVNYKNNSTKVCIVCPKHGEFWQTPNKHLRGDGCPICSANRKLDKERFIERSKIIHKNKYDYSKVEYVNTRTKVCIICPEHGEFWQEPSNHMLGHGCPKCGYVLSLLENDIKNFLESEKITYEQQKKFHWLKYKYPLSLDFYLPKYNIAIECQGEQHFNAVEYFGGMDELNYIKHRDERKKILCEKHNIKILYFSDKKYNDDIIIDKNKLLEEIIT